ncbi:hypothetical protein BU26DRAFT_79390 [Trematosphaeria pertusa]|uniref:DUF6594 domain-containing protein n=1 Tax=Trematosphaeria pertusa TaxID=390896 RepID=A0A6A6I2M4_9PLEO|nr:uncharacterized protein BU26DRAFT_79390 [Trematosphaeria pertusa]KAF2244527.1 hypothetical protein BU26DRAFT_79390 [Trematosphaeria pertusa]
MGAPDEDVISTIASSRSSISEPALHLDEDAKSAKIEITCEPLTPQDTTSGSDGDERVHAWDCGKQRRALSGQLASFMAESRSHSGTLFRRFDRANFRGLMGMEREVAVLEERLERLEGGRMVKEESVRELERELRERVREYYEAVLLTKEILALSRPSKNALLETRRAFPPEDFRPDSAEKTPYFSDKYYTRRQESDLSSLSPCADPDPLTRFFERQSDGGNVAHLVTFLSAICAVLFLVGAIVGLYFVSNARARLGMLGTFTVLFAAACASLGNVRRQDVFVATAA